MSEIVARQGYVKAQDLVDARDITKGSAGNALYLLRIRGEIVRVARGKFTERDPRT